MIRNRSESKTPAQQDPFCPSPIQLRNFVAGRLNNRIAGPLLAHLERCPLCGKDLGNYCRFFALKEAQIRNSELS